MIYDISCKTLIGAKPLRIKFDKADGFVRVYNDYRYLVLLASEKYDAICILIRYILSKKGVLHMVFHNSAKIKIALYHSLSLEKTLTLHNVTRLMKPVFNKNRNHYH